jgi:LPXTG-motif cell wall-anchored protein
MRRRARRNPSTQTTTLLIAGGGLALLGVGVYFFTKKPAAASTTTTAITATSPNSRPFGDPNDASTVAWACNTCWKLRQLGHPNEAGQWCAKCTANGGVVPQSAAQLYT